MCLCVHVNTYQVIGDLIWGSAYILYDGLHMELHTDLLQRPQANNGYIPIQNVPFKRIYPVYAR